MEAREITKPTNLYGESGKLSAESIGWSRQPYIRSNISSSFLRKKKWNYWCITSEEFLFSATISHIDYAAVLFVYVLDIKTKEFHENTILVPLGIGCNMPEGVHQSLQYKGKKLTISFEDDGDRTEIIVEWQNFSGKGKKLSSHITVFRPTNYESLNVVVPWNKKRYQFTSKQPALPATGVVYWNDKKYEFKENEAFGCLDFGRGKWPYRTTWNWGAASGNAGESIIGLNFGGQWTDGTGQSENGIIVDGKLHKIHEDVRWEYNKDNYMEPWVLKTKGSNRVDLIFHPIFERKAATNAIVIQSVVHQMIGTYSGSVIIDEGEVIKINSLIGWAEDHKASW